MERETLIPETFVDKHKKVHAVLVEEITKRVPMDTGRARASTLSTIGAPTSQRIAESSSYIPPTSQDVYRDLEGLKFGQSTYISNNARRPGAKYSYFAALDTGHSPQAQEIVRPAIQATVIRVKRSV